MVRIQLETGYLDVKEGTNFPLNFSLGDIRDISKRNGSFSKTITLEGTDNNHKLLNHYYDANIVEGTFNINTLTKCQVIQGGQPILDNSYVQLIKIIKSQTTDAHDQDVTYEVLIKDATSELFTKIGNKELTALDFSDYDSNADANEVYTAAKVVESFSHTIVDGFKYLMPWDTDNLYNVRAFHPAIYAKLYFDKIFADAGFTYEWGNLTPSSGATSDSNFFEKLIIPYNGATPKINRDSYIVEASKASYTTAQTGNVWSEQIVSWTEDLDAESIFDNTNGDYSVPFWIQNPENVTVRFTVDFDLTLENNYGGTIYRNPAAGISSNTMSVLEQGTTNEPSNLFYIDTTLATTYTASSSNTIVSNKVKTFEIPITNLDNSDILEFYIKQSFSQYYEDSGLTTPADVDMNITFNTLAIEVIVSGNTLGYNSNLELNRYIPDKVKQSDFVKSIFQMYNLFAEPDPTQPNKIILQHRDDYYDSGAEVDWTDKLAKNKPQTLRFLPELSSKKQVLTYKEDKDDANTTYLEATKEVYGQLEFTFDNEYTRGIDKKELIFSPTPIMANSFNAILPVISFEPNTNIRILIDGGTQTTNEFDIYNYYAGSTGVGSTDQTTAPLLTHFDDPINPSFDINFGVCDYYFYNEFNSKTNNNLYNNYWRRTLGQIDKGKMMTAYFDLNEADIQKLQLNDKIRISNSWWNINKVIDYNANVKGLTKVELLSVDEEIQFTPYADTPSYPPVLPHVGIPIRPVKPVKPTKPETVRPVKDVIEANTRNKNLYTTNQKTWIHGINNQLGADVKSAIIMEDNKTVTKDGVYVPTVDASFEVRLPDGTVWTTSGIQGSSFNVVDAGEDIVIDVFSQAPVNETNAATDTILEAGSFVPQNCVNANTDSV